LFVPGDRPERFDKAAESGADAIILDLEDSVAPAAKRAAREAVSRYLAAPARVHRFVRINPPADGTLDMDLAAMHGADGVMLPKAQGGDDV
ncbi:aldolase/citrate lyase family protein, partial [Clostridium perfringens]